MYEDGSSCDEDDINNRADAAGERFLEQAWKLEQIVRKHLTYHNTHHGSSYDSWDHEDVLWDIAPDLDRAYVSLDDVQRLEQIEIVISKMITGE